MKHPHKLGIRAAALLMILLLAATLAPVGAFAAEAPADGGAPPADALPAETEQDAPGEEEQNPPAEEAEEEATPVEEAQAPPIEEEAAPAEEEAAPADYLPPPVPADKLEPNADGVYEVGSVEDLFTLADMVNRATGATDFAGKAVVLTADIDLTGYLWTPIGTQARLHNGYQRPFMGNFDGGFHTITGLTVDTTGLATYDYGSGLFGFVARHTPASEIKNLILTEASITGGEFTAGVVGKLEGGTVSACAVVGDVTGGGKHVGGLVGQGGTVSQSFHVGSVTGLHTVGGIAGNATVQDCYNIGPVHATTTADHESSFAGGVLGSGTGPLRCYAVGQVTGKEGDASVGATTGFDAGVGPAVGTYFFDIDKSGLVAAYNYKRAIGLPTESMTYGDSLGAMNALGSAYTKRGGDSANFYYPELAVFAKSDVAAVAALSKNSVKAPTFVADHNPGWTHDEGNALAYTIRTPKDLRSLALAVNYGGIPGVNGGDVYDFAKCVISLEADLDLSAYENWEPIGKWVEEEFRVPQGLARPFKGRFNGNMHVISNITMNYPRADRPYDTSTALFGHLTYSSGGTGKEAQINGVILRNAKITGGKYTAGVVAHSDGVQVWYCGVLGDVTGGQYTGGVVARTKTAMTRRCFHRGEVKGTGDVGGVIGSATGGSNKIYECYNVGPVTGTGSNVGGVAGYGQVHYSYAAGPVSGGEAKTLGPVTGTYSTERKAVGCHFDSDLCGAVALANPGEALGVSTAKLVSSGVFSHILSPNYWDNHFVKRPTANGQGYYLELVSFALNADKTAWLPVSGSGAVPAAVASRDSVVAGFFLGEEDIAVQPITKRYDGSNDFGDISASFSLKDNLLPGATIVAHATAEDANAGTGKPLTLTRWELTGPGTEGVNLPDLASLTGAITPLEYTGPAPYATVTDIQQLAQTHSLSLDELLAPAPVGGYGTVSAKVDKITDTNSRKVVKSATVSGSTLTILTNALPAGSYSPVTISFTLSTQNYGPVAGTVELTVEGQEDVSDGITFADSAVTYGPGPLVCTPAALDDGLDPEHLSYSYAPKAGTGASLNSAGLPQSAGEYQVTASYLNGKYTGSQTALFTVRKLNIGSASLAVDPETFTQPDQKVTATHPLLPAGLLKWSWSFNGQRILGANTNSFTLSRQYEDGTLTVTAYHTVNCEGETSHDFTVPALSVAVRGVEINSAPFTLITGKSRQLTVNFTPEDAMDTRLAWGSSNPTVATVAANGTVTARGAGRALITATSLDGGHTGYCQLTVENSTITLGRARLLLGPGASQTVTLAANDPDATLRAELLTADRQGPSTLATLLPLAPGAGSVTVTQSGTDYGSCLLRVYDENDPGIWAECLVQTSQSTQPTVRHAAPATVTASVYRQQPGAITLQYSPGQSGAYLMEAGVGLGFEPVPGRNGASPTDLALSAQRTLNNAFALTAVDEDTLALTPKWSDVEGDAFLQLLKKGSYQVRIGVALPGQATRTDLIPETVTVKIDKKLPKLTAQRVDFNRFYPIYTQDIHITGGQVSSLARNDAAKTSYKNANTAALVDADAKPSQWLALDGTAQTLHITGEGRVKNKDAKLYLLARVEGWTVPVPVTVAVRSRWVAPGIKLQAAKGTLHHNYQATNGLPAQIIPKAKGATLTDLALQNIELAPNNTRHGATTYKNQNLYVVEQPTDFATSGRFTIRAANDEAELKNTKLLLYAGFEGGAKVPLVYSLTVMKPGAKITLKPAKKSVTLNHLLSETVDIPLATSISTQVDWDSLRITTPAGGPVTGISASQKDGVLTVKTTPASNPSLTKGASYKLRLTLPGLYHTKDNTPKAAWVDVTVKLPAGSTAQKVSASWSLAGSVDLSRPGTRATVTVKVKNTLSAFEASQDNGDFIITSPGDEPQDVTDQFLILPVEGTPNRWTVQAREGGALVKGSYKLSVSGVLAGSPVTELAAKTLTVRATRPKITRSPASGSLYRDNPANELVFTAATAGGYAPLRELRLKDAAAEDMHFELNKLADGLYSIGFKGNDAAHADAAKTRTLTLQVFTQGNGESTIPVTSFTMRVTVKQARP